MIKWIIKALHYLFTNPRGKAPGFSRGDIRRTGRSPVIQPKTFVPTTDLL